MCVTVKLPTCDAVQLSKCTVWGGGGEDTCGSPGLTPAQWMFWYVQVDIVSADKVQTSVGLLMSNA